MAIGKLKDVWMLYGCDRYVLNLAAHFAPSPGYWDVKQRDRVMRGSGNSEIECAGGCS